MSDSADDIPDTEVQPTATDTAVQPIANREREQLLATTWVLVARAFAAELSKSEPSAATLNAARAFLSDNGISVASLRTMDGFALPKELRDNLPKFHDEDTEDDK
jgi:hypothetical protein